MSMSTTTEHGSDGPIWDRMATVKTKDGPGGGAVSGSGHWRKHVLIPAIAPVPGFQVPFFTRCETKGRGGVIVYSEQ